MRPACKALLGLQGGIELHDTVEINSKKGATTEKQGAELQM